MRYLGLALVAEGPTDHDFLGPLLERAVLQVCRVRGATGVEVGRMLRLRVDPGEAPRLEDRILAAATDAYPILFIHTDGAGDPDRARRERVEPAARRIAGELSDRSRETVAVVPVREMEAWALADGDALRGAFGTGLSDAELGLPDRTREVEKILDPKQALQEVCGRVLGPRSRRKAREYLSVLGERVDLSRLSRLTAWRRLLEDLTAALSALNVVRA